jgi:hypothetical protein
VEWVVRAVFMRVRVWGRDEVGALGLQDASDLGQVCLRVNEVFDPFEARN